MKINAILICIVVLAFGCATGDAEGASFAPPPEAPDIKLPLPMPGPVAPLKTLGMGAALKLVEIHEHRYWHGWGVPLRFPRCYRRQRNQVHCRVLARLPVTKCEWPHWEPYDDVVHLGNDDRTWISTRFDKVLHLSPEACPVKHR